jgi:hypothetical protein
MKSSSCLSLTSCLLFCCTGTETGNPLHDQEAQLTLAPMSATVVRRELGDVGFESVSIRGASFALAPCDGQAPTVLFQDRAVDLLDAAIVTTQVPAGVYCAAIVGMGSDSDSFSAGRQVNNGQTRLTFESQLHAVARLELLEPLATTGDPPTWILGVDLAAWLDPIDRWLTNGEARLTLNDPETLALRQAQARSLRLYEDIDGDGQLDASDLAAPLSEPGVLQR